ncbi:MAG: hypothetical protein M1821_008173 [Bathelium mastoideum]|nr:MAG: hypothetical protein M1821_008173 [Bathelium mastoideum]KAI9693218.1 MAG: hypothetical protein M1822_005214 [Bathelium mastoideum]
MGQTSFELAAATAGDGTPLLSNVTRDSNPLGSTEVCDVDTCELSDTELSEGDRMLLVLVEFRLCCGVATAGDSDRPLPRIRPPPSDRREVMVIVAGGGELGGASSLTEWRQWVGKRSGGDGAE